MYDDGIVSEPVNQYDVQQALGCGSGDIGTLCTHANINPMARYKPVRHTKISALTDTERYNVRYGFDGITPSFSLSNPENKAVWAFLKPRGLSYNETYRISDFIKVGTSYVGYDTYAAAPFAFGVEGAKLDSNTVDGDGGVGFPIYVNSAVNGYYANSGSRIRWRQDTCITVAEMLNYYSGAAYIGFAIFDMDDPNYTSAVIVSNVRLSQVSSTVPTVIVTSTTKTLSGLNYPAVTLFQDPRRDGHTFRFIAFLYNNFSGGNPNTDAYVIMPNGIDVNSVAFVDGIDRHDVVMWLRNSIRGLKCSLISSGLTLAYVGMETVGSYQYAKHACYGTVSGTITTPNDWPNDGVRVKVTIRTDYGYPTSVTSPQNYVNESYVSLPAWGQTYTRTLATISQQAPFYVYIYKDVSVSLRCVTVSAVAIGSANIEAERINFENTFNVYATQ